MTFSPAIFDRHVAAFDEAGLAQAFAECSDIGSPPGWCFTVEKPNYRHRRLLRARRQRPRHRRAAEQRDELAAFHSITSSASASNVGGTSRSSAFAVVRLMTSSNLVGCSTGMSPGFVPR